MATLTYRTYDTAVSVANGPKLSEGLVAIGAVTAQTTDVVDPNGDNKPRYVRIFADADCFVEWNANPTATNDFLNGMPVGAENPEYIYMLANEKIAVIERL